MFDRLVDSLEIGGISPGGFVHYVAEAIHRHGVNRAQNGVRKALGRSLLQRQVVPRAEAGINGQRDRQRQRGFPVEDGDLLFVIVFFQNEVFLLEPADGSSLRVSDGNEHVDQIDVDVQRRGRLRLSIRSGRSGRGRRLLRLEPADEQQSGAESWRIFSSNDGIIPLTGSRACAVKAPPQLVPHPANRAARTVHLDAAQFRGLPRLRNSRAESPPGKGSPSAQTAPSSKYSFFQMGRCV